MACLLPDDACHLLLGYARLDGELEDDVPLLCGVDESVEGGEHLVVAVHVEVGVVRSEQGCSLVVGEEDSTLAYSTAASDVRPRYFGWCDCDCSVCGVSYCAFDRDVAIENLFHIVECISEGREC